jgi:hypothetical protein
MIKHIVYSVLLLAGLLLFSSCSVTRWEVNRLDRVDTTDFKLLQSEEFIQQMNPVTPSRPVFRLAMYARNSYEYKKKVEVERSLQRYQPRLGYAVFGLMGASAAFYAANTTEFESSLSRTQSVALNSAGALLVGMSFLNNKPVGEPKKTGETRLIRTSGSEIRVDTVRINGKVDEKVYTTVYHRNEVIIPRTEWDFSKGQVEINLAAEIQPVPYSGDPDEFFRIEFIRDGQVRNYNIPVSSVFQAFAEVKAEITPLRNAAEIDRENVLIDLAQGSQLELIEVSQLWTKVRYGTYESYISTDDINIIWRPSDFADRISVIEVPVVPFGNIDVEANLPLLYPATPERVSLIVANENYRNPGSERPYVLRDGRMMEEYFTTSLGVRDYRSVKIYDFESNQQVLRAYERFVNGIYNENSTGFVYLAGNGRLIEGKPYLLSIEGEERSNTAVDLESLFEALGRLKLKSLFVFADIDFSGTQDLNYNLNDLAARLTDGNNESVVFFSGRFGESSFPFMSAYADQKRHHIFPYFLASALKEKRTSVTAISEYLDRNVSYTARRLFNRPQEVMIFGNKSLNLAE